MCTADQVPDELDGIDICPPDHVLPQATWEARRLAGRTIANHAYLEESHRRPPILSST